MQRNRAAPSDIHSTTAALLTAIETFRKALERSIAERRFANIEAAIENLMRCLQTYHDQIATASRQDASRTRSDLADATHAGLPAITGEGDVHAGMSMLARGLEQGR